MAEGRVSRTTAREMEAMICMYITIRYDVHIHIYSYEKYIHFTLASHFMLMPLSKIGGGFLFSKVKALKSPFLRFFTSVSVISNYFTHRQIHTHTHTYTP